MSQTLCSVLPKLTLAPSETITDGVTVNAINFMQRKPPFKAAYFEVQPGHETPLDQHQVEETWIVLKGEGLLRYENQTHFIGEKDILYFASCKKHQVYNYSDQTLIICSLYW